MTQHGLLGATIGGGYRIDSELSGGNMGMVYRATQLSVDRRVALKVIKQDRALNAVSVDRFFREARVISRLEHPHIVRLYDFGRDESHDLLYLVMEFIDGPTLSDLLRTNRFTQQLVVEIAIQICRALVESHSQNVVHRDLKPANILLSCMSDGSLQLKVVDFGVARAVETLDKQLTAEGAICGTPRYMPPEQARHSATLDGRADLYALGLLMYEMLCGYPPFDAEDAIELIFKHLKEEERPLSMFLTPQELHPHLEALTHELLRKSPSQRPPDALTVMRRLEDIRSMIPGRQDALRLDSQRGIYEQLLPLMAPGVQEARAALVYGNTSQIGSEEFDMEPLETEWDHTHTVRVDLNSIVNPFAPPTQTPPPRALSRPVDDEATIPPELFDSLNTQLIQGAPPQSMASAEFHAPVDHTLPELSPADMETLHDHTASPRPAPPVITALPKKNKTLSGTLQSFFLRLGGQPAPIAENTAENMFLNSSEEEIAAIEDRLDSEAKVTERLLVPVMIGVVLCVIGVIGFMTWKGDETLEEPDTTAEVNVAQPIVKKEGSVRVPVEDVSEDPPEVPAIQSPTQKDDEPQENSLSFDELGAEEPEEDAPEPTKESVPKKPVKKKKPAKKKPKDPDAKSDDLEWLSGS